MNIFWICAIVFLLILWIIFESLKLAPKWMVSILLVLLVLSYLQVRDVKYPEPIYITLICIVLLSFIWNHRDDELIIIQEDYSDLVGIKTGSEKNKQFENAIKNERIDFSEPKMQTDTTLGIEDVALLGDESEDEEIQKKKRTGKSAKEFSPDEAQRATFQLIDTVEQLKTTMETMEPVLRQGASVLGMFERMKMPALSELNIPNVPSVNGPADFESMLKVLEKSVHI